MKDDSPKVERPELTFVPEVQEFLRGQYEKADVILEYGSGGSTVMASEMKGKTIYSIESSRVWTKMMKAWFEQDQPVSMPEMRHVNIGKTGKWGTPVDGSAFQRYHLYPLAIWDEPEFKHPDVVLVDGRFRVACAFATMLRAEKPVTLLFDDYMGRKGYHSLEDFVERKDNVANMARFEIEPDQIPKSKMTQIIGQFSQHF